MMLVLAGGGLVHCIAVDGFGIAYCRRVVIFYPCWEITLRLTTLPRSLGKLCRLGECWLEDPLLIGLFA